MFAGLLRWVGLGGVVLSLFAGSAHADEAQERVVMSGLILTLVKTHNFRTLDAVFDESRGEMQPGPGGVLHLSHLWTYLDEQAEQYGPQAACNVNAAQMARDWLKADPKSVTARLFRANVEIEAAWCIRGGGFADAVPPDRWAPFKAALERARTDLEADRDLAVKDGEWFYMMQRVALGESWAASRYLSLVTQGITLHPTYYKIADNGAIYFSPKWGGSNERVDSYAKAELRDNLHQLGLGLYARIYWWYADINGVPDLRSDTKVDWSLMKKSMDDIVENYPDRWNIESFARLSCSSRDFAGMRRYMEMVLSDNRVKAWEEIAEEGHCNWIMEMPLSNLRPPVEVSRLGRQATASPRYVEQKAHS